MPKWNFPQLIIWTPAQKRKKISIVKASTLSKTKNSHKQSQTEQNPTTSKTSQNSARTASRINVQTVAKPQTSSSCTWTTSLTRRQQSRWPNIINTRDQRCHRRDWRRYRTISWRARSRALRILRNILELIRVLQIIKVISCIKDHHRWVRSKRNRS